MTIYIPDFWMGVIASHLFWIATVIIYSEISKRKKQKGK